VVLWVWLLWICHCIFWYEIVSIQRITLAPTAGLTSIFRKEATSSSTTLGKLLPNYTASHLKTGIKYSMMCGHPFCQVRDILRCNLREAPDQRSVLQYKACPQTHKQHLTMTMWASLNLVLDFGNTNKWLYSDFRAQL